MNDYFNNEYMPKMNRIGKITGYIGVISIISSFGVLWFVEPISYYPVVGQIGTYMAFLSGNISNMRVPCASMVQVSAEVEPGTHEGSIIATIGVCQEPTTLSDVKQIILRCRKAMKMGRILYLEQNIWFYDMLGMLAWIQIPEQELEGMLKEYRELLKEPKNAELLKTLKVYLENNMNYSVTTEKLYLNINTVRKRIDKVNSILPIDWNNYVQRLNIELLLQILNL